ncbi:hypothetical protein [Anaerosporobacter sp.]
MEESIEDKILNYIIKRYRLDGIMREQLLDVPLIKLPENSIDFLRLMIDIEEIAGVEFSDGQLDIKNYETVRHLIGQVMNLISSNM